jgi:group I intron endonuclease
MGFIYKITNTITQKCYIGETKSINPEDRWKQHQYTFTRNGGCPALRDAVKKYGINNFKFQVLIICFDVDRYIYEKEYIKKYNSVVPNGYNILEGGEGGGFKGKQHSEETKQILKNKSIKRFEDIKIRQILREKTLKQMKDTKDAGIDWGKKVRSSEKFKKALEDGNIGGKAHGDGNGHLANETKNKISESLKKYYNTNTTNINIEKHRNVMAKSVGICVEKYTKEGILIKTYQSISEAARDNGIHKNAIQQSLDISYRSSGGFIWKRKILNKIITV